MAINQITHIASGLIEAKYNAWHQIANNNEITDAYSKALDGNGSIEYYGQIGISDLGQGEEGRLAWFEVLCTSSL